MSCLRSVKRLVARFPGIVLAYALVLVVLPIWPVSATAPLKVAATQDQASQQEQAAQLIPTIAPGSAYRQSNLVSDIPGIAGIQDPLLVNPWGISFAATGPFWSANNGTSTSTLYREAGAAPLVKNPGLAGITIPGGLPTGTVFNNGGATDFVVTSGAASGKSSFIFSSITGNITAWNLMSGHIS